jgi:hypothetical protein
MRDELMTASASGNFQSRIIHALKRLVPKGSALDTIFDSYDDWRDVETEEPVKSGEKDNRNSGSEAGT